MCWFILRSRRGFFRLDVDTRQRKSHSKHAVIVIVDAGIGFQGGGAISAGSIQQCICFIEKMQYLSSCSVFFQSLALLMLLLLLAVTGIVKGEKL